MKQKKKIIIIITAWKSKMIIAQLSVLIWDCSSPRWIRYISHHPSIDMHIGPIWYSSNENKTPIRYVFHIDPISIWYVENAAWNLSKILTVLILIFSSHMRVHELCEPLHVLHVPTVNPFLVFSIFYWCTSGTQTRGKY